MDDGGNLEDEVKTESDWLQRIDNLVDQAIQSHEDIDDLLRSYLSLVTKYKYQYIQSELDLARCCYRLLQSPIFKANEEYIRRQIVFGLLEDDDADTLYLAAALCLYDGKSNESVFEMMQAEGAFSRIVQLITLKPDNDDDLHRLLLELLYEMSRVQRLDREEFATVNDDFILYLFQLIEALSNDADDPYHYPVIRVLLIFNEQYMCLSNASSERHDNDGMTNRILKLLSSHGPSYRTFGENLILLLNRESALGPQLLMLKMLYLLFTTPTTFEYFYTNDLHVLVDVIIRNLLDLDLGTFDMDVSTEDLSQEGQRTLRHTYLRVLCPLLRNTQLSREGSHYKREELRRLLSLLVNHSSAHFAPVDQTIARLVLRCKQIPWLKEEDDPEDAFLEQQLAQADPGTTNVAKKLLGMSLDTAAESSLSLLDVSANITKPKPRVPAPRRTNRKPPPVPEGNRRGGTDEFLAVPALQVSNVSDAMQEKERSPFADQDDAP